MATREKFPPAQLTDDEARAVVGRFVMSQRAVPAPKQTAAELADDNDYGRTPAAPHGVVYVNPDGPGYS